MQLIKTPGDLGQRLKARRKQLGLNQAQLAEQIGVSRQWLIDIEKGKARAELGLVLRAIYALGLSMHLDQGKDEPVHRSALPDINLDWLFERSNTGTAEQAKTPSTGIPDDIHRLMREQNNVAGPAKRMSTANPHTDISAALPERRRTRSSPGGKSR